MNHVRGERQVFKEDDDDEDSALHAS